MARRKKPVDENGEAYPQPFAGYEVYEKLGTSSGVTTWAARDLRLERDVTLKEITPNLDLREDIVEEFFSETSSVARIRHENIIRGLDTGRSGDKFYFVMEDKPSDNLEALFQSNTKIKEERALEIVESIAKAFDCLYEEGLSHGTVIPENIMLGRDGIVRLSSLGFPVNVLFRDHSVKALEFVEYSAPEMFEENSYPDISSDLYSLGIILYRMLTGKHPFSAESRLEMSRKHREEDPVSPRVVSSEISEIASSITMSLLAKDPSDRICEPRELLEKIYSHSHFADRKLPEKDMDDEDEDNDDEIVDENEENSEDIAQDVDENAEEISEEFEDETENATVS